MARLVEDAPNGKAQVQRLADRISGIFVPVVIVLSLMTLGAWHGRSSMVTAFTAAVADADHRVPLCIGVGNTDGADGPERAAALMGILIKGPQVLESTRRSTPSCSTRPGPSPPGA